MSIRQMAEVWYTPSLAPNQRLVAAALADYADDHGRCFPSLQNIAAKTGYSWRNTQRVVQQLREIGYVEILIEATPHRAPLYQLRPDVLEAYERPSDQPDLPMMPDRDDIADAVARQDVTPEGRQDDTPEVTDSQGRDDTGGAQARQDVTLNRQEPPEEPSSEPAPLALLPDEEIERITDTTTATDVRPRNPGWDALEDIFGYRPESGSHEAALWGRLAAKANAEPDPEQAVKLRAIRLIGQWGVAKLTPNSLEKWWQRFGSKIGAATEAEVEKMRQDHAQLERRRRAAELEGGPEQLEEQT